MGRGNIRATVEVFGKTYSRIINDVLYVPGLGVNLFSIAAATEVGLEARFSNNEVIFYRNNLTVLAGERADNTLYLRLRQFLILNLITTRMEIGPTRLWELTFERLSQSGIRDLDMPIIELY